MGDDGNPFYQKHKIFLDRQDFDKFLDAFNECSAKVSELKENAPESTHSDEASEAPNSTYTDVNFDDLGK
jgi:hypothetical protein